MTGTATVANETYRGTTSLRADLARSSDTPPRFDDRTSIIDRELDERLRVVGSPHAGVDLVLLAAFAALIARYTGDAELCIATGRNGAEVIHVDAPSDLPFLDLVDRIAVARANARGVAAAEDRTAALAFTFDTPNASLWRSAAHQLVANASLSETGRAIRWRFESGTFLPDTIDRMAAHYGRLLESIVADPTCVVSRLAMTSAAERERSIALGRGPKRPYERDETIHGLFAKRANLEPDATAAIAHDGHLTYRELDKRSGALARALVSHGVRPGSTVGIAIARSIATPIVLLAILKAGAAYVPLDPAYPRARLALMVHDASVVAIVADRAAFAQMSTLGVRTIAPGATSDAPHAAAIGVATDANALAYVTYTSGSTGRPKGVAVTHRGVVRLVRNTNFIELGSSDTFLHVAPLAFDASTLELWGPLLNGATVALPHASTLAIEDLTEAIERFGVTAMWLTAALFQRAVESASPRFGALRVLLVGGDVVSPAHARTFVRAFPACRLINGYGPTENTTFSTTHEIALPDTATTSVPIGTPIANSAAYVLDEHGEPAPHGVPGELYVGGDGVARGYVGLPELTMQRFVPDPFSNVSGARMYRTGDRVRLRHDGAIEFMGRSDDQVKIRGYRIELGEIEAALKAHAELRDAAVVAGDVSGEKTLVAYAVRTSTSVVSEVDLRTYLASRLPRFMIPHRIVFATDLPSHASGKIDRVALGRIASEVPVAPPSARRRARDEAAGLERDIADLWYDLLRRSTPVDLDENFFDAGGDSLLVLALKKRLAVSLGISLSVAELFEHTTIRAMAAHVARGRSSTASAASHP